MERVLREAAALDKATVARWEAEGVEYRSCEYESRPLPAVSVSVVAAEVSKESFDRTTADRACRPVEGLGDAATFDRSTGTLRVLQGSVVFAIAVREHLDPLATATALATRALVRLNPPQ